MIGNYSNCMRGYPANGTWLVTNSPPFYQPNDCPTMTSYDKEEVISCLRNRTIYVIGHSVARQFAFGLLSLMGEDDVDRANQKKLCLKGQQSTEKGYSCRFESKGVTVKYLYKNTLDGYHYGGEFPFFIAKRVEYKASHEPSPFYSSNGSYQRMIDHFASGGMNHKGSGYSITDNCDGYDHGDDTSTCLRQFFNGSVASDVLIFSLGFVYAGYNRLDDRETPIDYKAWLTHSAVKFSSYLKQWFAGSVFWFTVPPVHPHKLWYHMNSGIVEVNNLLWELWRPHASKRAWYVIDQWAINGDRFHLYNDEIHFQGNLTSASLYNILNVVCIDNKGDRQKQKQEQQQPPLPRQVQSQQQQQPQQQLLQPHHSQQYNSPHQQNHSHQQHQQPQQLQHH